MNWFKIFFLLAVLMTPRALLAFETHPFNAEDLVSFKRISAPEVSPDGRYVAYVLRETDLETDSGRTDIWILDLENVDAGPKRLTTHEENDAQPRWSPDGKTIYFLSNRTGLSQLFSISVAGGEAMQLTNFPIDLELFRLSADGGTIVFTAFVYPDCRNLTCTATRFELLEQTPETGIVYDRLMARYWDAWRDGRMSRLFVMELDGAGLPKPEEPVPLMNGLDAAVPAYALMGSETFAVSPDGKTVYFSTIERTADEAWSVNSDIYSVRTDGKRGPENLTRRNPASDVAPVISPDGEWLAWLATSNPDSWSEGSKVRLMNLDSGKVTTLAQGWDRYPSAIAFDRNASAILATADDMGERTLWRLPLDGGAPEKLAGSGSITDAVDSAHGIVFARSDLAHPADLHLLGEDGEEQITAVNADMLADIETGAYEQFSFTGAGGDTVYGYAVHPVGFSEKRKYPIALLIHGGPHGSMGNNFHYRWNPQTYAGAGYAVVVIDFHGSTGYGQAFTDAIHGNRGAMTLDDLDAGLKAAAAKYPWLDGDRACAIGGSFGGYMVNLIAGVWPDRFKCLVTHDGMFDNRMKYYTSDIIGYLEESFGGEPYFADMSSHETDNPATLVDNWKTPILVIHGDKDYRVPVTHGIAAFTAAQRKGVESRLLMFPDENHWVLRPGNSIQWHKEVQRWLDQHLKP